MLAGLMIWLLAGSVFADTWSGKVVAVKDGDSMTVMKDGSAVQIRLKAIDAPELGQPFGKVSRQSLAGLCAGREAMIDDHGMDRYQRLLARVTCDDIEVNAEQIRRGLAWHYTQYSNDRHLGALQSEAQAKHAGLWQEKDNKPPMQYRRDRESRSSRQDDFSKDDHASLPDDSHGTDHCGSKHFCNQMKTCAEAVYYLRHCGVDTLDGDGDGEPCETLCSPWKFKK